MDPQKITDLANLLRNNGDKVLNSEFKLTLTGSLLRGLNDSFILIADSTELGPTQSFQVVKPNNSKSNVFRDLQLVHDFVQKTVLLCITHYPTDDYFDGVIDISKFRALKRLEIQKTNVKQIVGIQPLRSQLQQLICTRSLESVVDIITNCGGDKSNGFVWNELKSADFSYNNLRTVDCSLEFAQYLQHLNLRHNQLVSVEAIKWLPNLKTLDLSFNRLTLVPTFHIETSKRLQVLNLSNNLIEEIIGLSKLVSLIQLDLSDNCLLDHNNLHPLKSLIALQYLNLYGNPLYCHPKHRLAAAQFLHKNTSTVKFILDYEPLSKSEKALTGIHQSNHHMPYPSRYLTKSSSRPAPGRQSSANQTPASSVESIKTMNVNGENKSVDMSSSITEKIRRSKVRTVIFETSDHTSNDATPMAIKDEMRTSVEVNKDHLETKKQIENLREKYGAGWLQNENAQMVHSALGLSPSKGPALNSDNKMSAQQIFDDLMNVGRVEETNNYAIIASTPKHDNTLDELTSDIDKSTMKDSTVSEHPTEYESIMSDRDDQTLYQSVVDDVEERQDDETEEIIDTAAHLKDIYSNTVDDESEISEPEDDEETYKVYSPGKKDDVFLTVSGNYIREKDTLNLQTKAKWSLRILESCDRTKSNTLRINFDTIKSDKKERVYIVEEELCKELEKRFRDILSQRDLSEMNQKVYRCIKCSCQFSQESTLKNYRKRNIVCPNCKSSMFVTEIQTMPKSLEKEAFPPSKAFDEQATSANEIAESIGPSVSGVSTQEETRESSGERDNSLHGSVGKGPSRLTSNNKLSRSLMQSLNQNSVNSLNESSSCSKISQSQSSFDSNQSVAGSSATDRDNDFKSNCESDVDIISNPSQSSIEVLDHHSIDGRSVHTVPLETINDNFVEPTVSTGQHQTVPKDTEEIEKKLPLGQTLLTESSSSGSVTDSVCTTYEQGDKTPTKSHLIREENMKPLAEEINRKEESMLSSMFGGLFQSTNMLMSRTSQRLIDSESSSSKCEKYKCNYTDFSDVDHRLKLYFYQTKFEKDGEHFKWIVKGKIYNENSGALFDGIVVMSTMKLYLMEAFAPESDNVSKWLRLIVSVTADRLETIQLLPWKVGLAITLRDWGGIMLLLQDILRTDSLLLHFTKSALPSQCEVIYQPSEKVISRLASTANDEQLKMFSLLNACEVKSEKTVQNYNLPCLFTTDDRVYLSVSNISWLTQNSELPIELNLSQFMTNLVEVERTEDHVFTLNFLNDTLGKSELWKCTFETRENAESCLNAIGQSWEKLFGVSLLGN